MILLILDERKMKATEEKDTSNLNKHDFINLIAKKCETSKVEAERIINYFTKGIEEVIAQGNKLTLVGFGSFYIAETASRDGRNPRTGEIIKIAASKTPKFKAGSDLKKLCNK